MQIHSINIIFKNKYKLKLLKMIKIITKNNKKIPFINKNEGYKKYAN